MAGYTNVNQQIIDGILSLYADEKVQEWVPMTHGISNSNFKIITQSKKEFLLKISNDKTQRELEDELFILNHLKENNYPYSIAPHSTYNGNHVFGYEDYYGVLFPFVYGQTPVINSSTCRQVGQALANLHKTTSHHEIRPYQNIGQDYLAITGFMKNNPDSEFTHSTKMFFNNMDFSLFTSGKLPRGIIHGDLYYDNTLFENNKLGHVLDFEQSGVGHFIFDIGVSISGSCLDSGYQIDSKLTHDFLEGYEQVRPLESLEKSVLNQAIILGLLSVSLWRIIRFNQKQIAKNKEDSFKELLKRAHHFYQGIS